MVLSRFNYSSLLCRSVGKEQKPQLRLGRQRRVKEYHDGSTSFPTRPIPLTRPEPVAITNDGSPEWAVERILDHRRYGRRKVLQYLILWKGYPVHEATWEPIEALDGALELVVDYNTRKKLQMNVAEALDFREFTVVDSSRNHRAKAA